MAIGLGAGAAIAGASSLVSTAAQGLSTYFSNKQNHKYAKELREIDKNNANWLAEQQYNRELAADSTKIQRSMADMDAAGINPIMAAGGMPSAGSVSGGSASASGGMPEYGSYSGKALDIFSRPFEALADKMSQSILGYNNKKNNNNNKGVTKNAKSRTK